MKKTERERGKKVGNEKTTTTTRKQQQQQQNKQTNKQKTHTKKANPEPRNWNSGL